MKEYGSRVCRGLVKFLRNLATDALSERSTGTEVIGVVVVAGGVTHVHVAVNRELLPGAPDKDVFRQLLDDACSSYRVLGKEPGDLS